MTAPIDYAALEALRTAWENTEIYDIASGFMNEVAYNQALRNAAPMLIAAAEERDELDKCGHPSTLDILRATGRELGERTDELARARVLLDEAVENEDRILEEMKMRRDEFSEYRIQASTELARVQAMLDEALAAKPVRCGYCDGTGRDKTGQSCGGCAGTGTPSIFRRKDTP